MSSAHASGASPALLQQASTLYTTTVPIVVASRVLVPRALICAFVAEIQPDAHNVCKNNANIASKKSGTPSYDTAIIYLVLRSIRY